MTSILKQNTLCFALPLCRMYRQWGRVVSIAKGGAVYLYKYSGARRETVMVVTVLSSADVFVSEQQRVHVRLQGRRVALQHRARWELCQAVRIGQARNRRLLLVRLRRR
jgi:hypothetical protein